MPIYEFKCKKCGVPFEVVQKMNIEEHIAFHCDTKAQRIFSVFQTNADLMYQFTCSAFGKPVEINSRRQYKKLLKKNGAADATISECLSVKRKDNSKDKVKKLSKDVRKEIHDKGAMDWCTGKTNPNGPDNIKDVV